MSLLDSLQIPAPDANGHFGLPAGAKAHVDSVERQVADTALLEAGAKNDALVEKLDVLNELLAKPLNEILAERDRFKEAAAAWDAFGAMWVLSQRAMKRVALDLGAQLGVSPEDVVACALAHANDVLNGDAVDLDGTIAQAQMEHIARHKAFLRKQFR